MYATHAEIPLGSYSKPNARLIRKPYKFQNIPKAQKQKAL